MTTTNRASNAFANPPSRGGGMVNRIRAAAAEAAEDALREMPSTLRRLRTLLVVVSITVPAFLAGLLAVLWRLAR